MATLIREKPASSLSLSETATTVDSDLAAHVPTPFPKELAQELLHEPAAEDFGLDAMPSDARDSTSCTPVRPTICVSQVEIATNQEVGPSLSHVKQSCLIALNNLLSQDAPVWQPIVPTRRHSLPAHSPTSPPSNAQALFTSPTSSWALQTLVSNLRQRDDSEMREVGGDDDASLLNELANRVEILVNNCSIQPRDARLAQSLVSLLTHLNRLSDISPNSSHRSPVDTTQPSSTVDIYDTLRRQVSELQSTRDAHGLDQDPSVRQAPVQVVEHALLWNKIDDDLDEVFRLCRECTEPVQRSSSPHAPSLPPEYDLADYEPPSYDPAEYSDSGATKATLKDQQPAASSLLPQTQNVVDEKMRLDLEAVTMAIDRLYLVAPQLSNQRVELKRSKLEQMEQARASGSNIATGSSMGKAAKRKDKAKEMMGNGSESAVVGRKMDEQDVRELDTMLELINKASTRRIEGQSVILDGDRGMADRVERARLRDLEARDAFHERLIAHSGVRRLTSQDAVLHKSSSIASLSSRIKNPDALLTLPEFIREAIPDSVPQSRDPEALLTLPEFVRELPSLDSPSTSDTPEKVPSIPTSKLLRKPFKPSRNRSLSAPPLALAWLLTGSTSTSRLSSPLTSTKSNDSIHTNGGADGRSSPIRAGLEVQYVAEHQENLQSVAVFLQVSGGQAGIEIEAEVIPSAGERFIVKCGASTSAPLSLPARVTPGKQEVKVQSGHLEVKLACLSQTNGHASTPMHGNTLGTGLLDATQLKALNPTSFICASCSLPLVQSSRLSRYDDLPSEHWAELLEAWMCHSDQNLTQEIAKQAHELWPSLGQALVGGSYILFDSSSIMTNNIRAIDYLEDVDEDDWRPVHCICGAVTGRCRRHISNPDSPLTTYRLAKYAIRPVSPSSDPTKIPLSAFILQDMDELVHAHATYRFIISDEEDEKPRILIWMFKPHIRLSYATSNHYFMARSASIQAAKVHFKILGPSVSPTVKSTTERYPAFAQSERLLYPLDVCRRLAGLLKESNTAYPQGRRVMGGLDVGWLLRV